MRHSGQVPSLQKDASVGKLPFQKRAKNCVSREAATAHSRGRQPTESELFEPTALAEGEASVPTRAEPDASAYGSV